MGYAAVLFITGQHPYRVEFRENVDHDEFFRYPTKNFNDEFIRRKCAGLTSNFQLLTPTPDS